jgi:nucleotide-binding universal stress UspA family protein
MKILIAIDGSTHSDAAVEEVARLPWPAGSEVRVISVIELPILSLAEFPAWPDYLDEIDRALSENANAAVEAALSMLRAGEGKNLTLTSEIIHGSAKQIIIDDAKQWGADLIVLGSRGLGALDRFFLGSVSSAVVHHAPCSVEVVRREESDQSERQ